MNPLREVFGWKPLQTESVPFLVLVELMLVIDSVLLRVFGQKYSVVVVSWIEVNVLLFLLLATLSCPTQTVGEWIFEATPAGETASIACPPHQNGSISRVCKEDGTWDTPSENCSMVFIPFQTFHAIFIIISYYVLFMSRYNQMPYTIHYHFVWNV